MMTLWESMIQIKIMREETMVTVIVMAIQKEKRKSTGMAMVMVSQRKKTIQKNLMDTVMAVTAKIWKIIFPRWKSWNLYHLFRYFSLLHSLQVDILPTQSLFTLIQHILHQIWSDLVSRWLHWKCLWDQLQKNSPLDGIEQKFLAPYVVLFSCWLWQFG